MNAQQQVYSPEPRSDFGGFAERRGTSRFPLQEELRYRLLHSKSNPVSGVGRTLNIGSRGILFTTQGQLPVGSTVEIAVNWPARLDGTCPLKFVAVGHVIRADSNRAAVRIDRYQFKTRGNGASTLSSTGTSA